MQQKDGKTKIALRLMGELPTGSMAAGRLAAGRLATGRLALGRRPGGG